MSPTGGPRVARVVPDVTGLDKYFDYLVPDELAASVVVGSLVRAPLHGRRIGGWVIDADVGEPAVPLSELSSLLRWSGHGPGQEMFELAEWASHRWAAARLRPFLAAASPPTMVRTIGPDRRTMATSARADAPSRTVERIPPTVDPLPRLIELCRAGPTIVIHPSIAAVPVIADRLRRRGVSVATYPDQWAAAACGVDVVVGSRSAAWAPCDQLRLIVVLDEHDEAHQQERTPTWHSRDVAVERARRCGAAVHLISPCPTATAIHWAGGTVLRPAVATERAAWPIVDVIDRTDEEPWKRSLISSRLIADLRRHDQRVVCVLNTPGRSRLLACRACRSLQRCQRCDAAVALTDDRHLRCPRCSTERPEVCQQCGSSAMANVKPGVARIREELEAAANRPVQAVTGDSTDELTADVLVGTEAVLHRAGRTDVVAFLDLDTELLAPRYRAAEQAMVLIARAARLLGNRARGGRLLLQTFLPQHEVVVAALLADPGRVSSAEIDRRRLLSLPPFGALASVSGTGAAEFAASSGLASAAHFNAMLLRASDWNELGDALAATPRRRDARLRLVVDPPRV